MTFTDSYATAALRIMREAVRFNRDAKDETGHWWLREQYRLKADERRMMAWRFLQYARDEKRELAA